MSLKFFRKIFMSFRKPIARMCEDFSDKNVLISKKGQIAIVLLFITAIALILYGLTLNIVRSAEHRTTVIVASNSSASMMASLLASYGQKLFKEQLGGKKKVCKGGGGALGIIVAIILFVVLIFLAFLTAGGALAGIISLLANPVVAWTAAAVLVIGALAIGVKLYITVAIVPAQISSMWNKMMANASPADQFAESGMQSALGIIVTDSEEIPDFLDLDSDGLYGFYKSGPQMGEPIEKVSRYSLFYTERLREKTIEGSDEDEDENDDIQEPFTRNMDLSMVRFRDGLADFIYDNPDGLTSERSDDPRLAEKEFLKDPLPEENPFCDPLKSSSCSCSKGEPNCGTDENPPEKNPAYDPGRAGRTRDFWGLYDPLPIREESYYPPETAYTLGSITSEIDPGQKGEYVKVPVRGYYFPRVEEATACYYNRDGLSNKIIPTECNFCCLPEKPQTKTGGWQSLMDDVGKSYKPNCCDCKDRKPRPEFKCENDADGNEVCEKDPLSCDGSPNAAGTPENECGRSDTCDFYSPFTAFNPISNTNYTLVYSQATNNWENNPYTNSDYYSYDWKSDWDDNDPKRSFIMAEELGQDDENPYYFRDPRTEDDYSKYIGVEDNDRTNYSTPTMNIGMRPHSCGEQGFRIEDATGYQNNLLFPALDQKKGKIFPFLYRLSDWGIDLSNIHPDKDLKVLYPPSTDPSDTNEMFDPLYSKYHQIWKSRSEISNAQYHENYYELKAPMYRHYLIPFIEKEEVSAIMGVQANDVWESLKGAYISETYTENGRTYEIRNENGAATSEGNGIINKTAFEALKDYTELVLPSQYRDSDKKKIYDLLAYGMKRGFILNSKDIDGDPVINDSGFSYIEMEEYCKATPFSYRTSLVSCENFVLYDRFEDAGTIVFKLKRVSDVCNRYGNRQCDLEQCTDKGYNISWDDSKDCGGTGIGFDNFINPYISIDHAKSDFLAWDKLFPPDMDRRFALPIQQTTVGNEQVFFKYETVWNDQAQKYLTSKKYIPLKYGRNMVVDGTDKNYIENGLPVTLAIDNIRLPTNIIAKEVITSLKDMPREADCAQGGYYDPKTGFWRKGFDQYCSEKYPYNQSCLKHRPKKGTYNNLLETCMYESSAEGTPKPGEEVTYALQDCMCGDKETANEEYPDDVLDDIVNDLNVFVIWSKNFLNTDPRDLAKTFDSWYQIMASIIEPAKEKCDESIDDEDLLKSNFNGLNKYICYQKTNEAPGGVLFYWVETFSMIKERLNGWFNGSWDGGSRKFWGIPDKISGQSIHSCRQVWCAPSKECDMYYPKGEEKIIKDGYIDIDGKSHFGDVEQVLACLDWNANDANGPAAENVLRHENKVSVLLLGDSISLQYYPVLKEMLKNEAEVYRPDPSPSTTQEAIDAHLEKEWLNRKWDIIYFNWGSQDSEYLCPAQNACAVTSCQVRGFSNVVPLERYKENLNVLASSMRNTGANVIFGNTTTVLEDRFNCRNLTTWEQKNNDQIDQYNQGANDVLSGKAAVAPLNIDNSWLAEDGVHLKSEYVYRAAEQVRDAIRSQISGGSGNRDLQDFVPPLNEQGQYDFKGNAVKYHACAQTCSPQYCTDLPRSIVPDFDPSEFNGNLSSSNKIKMKALLNCWDKCTQDACDDSLDVLFNKLASVWKVIKFNGGSSYTTTSIELNALNITDPSMWRWQNSDLQDYWNEILITPLVTVTVADTGDTFEIPRIALFDETKCYEETTTMDDPATPQDEEQKSTIEWMGPKPENPWHDPLVNSMKQLGGEVCDPQPSGWLGKARMSALEAENQVRKMRQRIKFLETVKTDWEYLRDNFFGDYQTYQNYSGIIGNIKKFLSCEIDPRTKDIVGPGCRLIRERRLFDYIGSLAPGQEDPKDPKDPKEPKKKKNKYTNEMIYGWKSKALDKKGDGAWHIVRVEVKIPEKGLGGKWPWIESYTTGGFFNKKVCFKLSDSDGKVVAKVERWDEGQKGLIFPNKVKIWDYRYGKEGKTFSDIKISDHYFDSVDDAIINNCIKGDSLHKKMTGWYKSSAPDIAKITEALEGAFLLNKKDDNQGCWDTAKKFLEDAVSETSCAAYKLGKNYKIEYQGSCE